MHKLIQDLGTKLGKSTHLSLQGNAWKNLQNLEGKNDIEGLILDFTTSTNGQVTTFLFERMLKLRLLQIIGSPDIKGNFKNLFPNLRCIRWHSCPWTHIPSTFSPHNLVSIDMPSSKFKILWKGPRPIKQLNNLSCLNLSHCPDIKRLPDQLGDMKALKKIDASYSAIEKLPDSITQLKKLVELIMWSCKKLRKLPEEIGNMEGLQIFTVGNTAIEQLPDSFGGLTNLVGLGLSKCKNLRNLPNSICKLKLLKILDLLECPKQLGKMQCLEYLSASRTAIHEVSDSIELLTGLQVLYLSNCKKLKCVPESIWNLTSIEDLTLQPGDTGRTSLPDSVKNMKKLKTLELSCNVRLYIQPMILCFSSLERLTLNDDGQILSSAKPFSLSKLFNLRYLKLENFTSLGFSLLELPLNLEELRVYNHNSLEQLPDLSSLKQLKILNVKGCSSLQSVPLLASHLTSLSVHECRSLQEVPDLSMLMELENLSFIQCYNLKLISLKPSWLQVGQPRLPFTADLPNREVAEWFDYKSSGHTVSFDIPPSFGSNFLGLALWVVYTCKASKENWAHIRAIITNNTEGTTENYPINVYAVVGEAQSRVQCITGEKVSMKSGDRIKVSIPSLLYYSDHKLKVPVGEVKVKMCGVHVILSTSA